MKCLRAAFLATAAVGLMALATPASAQVIVTPDGHYYRLVPLRGPLPERRPRRRRLYLVKPQLTSP